MCKKNFLKNAHYNIWIQNNCLLYATAFAEAKDNKSDLNLQ